MFVHTYRFACVSIRGGDARALCKAASLGAQTEPPKELAECLLTFSTERFGKGSALGHFPKPQSWAWTEPSNPATATMLANSIISWAGEGGMGWISIHYNCDHYIIRLVTKRQAWRKEGKRSRSFRLSCAGLDFSVFSLCKGK